MDENEEVNTLRRSGGHDKDGEFGNSTEDLTSGKLRSKFGEYV